MRAVNRWGAVIGAVGLAVSCGISPPPPHDEDSPVATAAQPLSDPGNELFVPLRFVTLQSCQTCDHAAPYADVLASVDAANEVFKAAGIQFWVKSYEKRWLPQFANITKFVCGGSDIKIWTQVRSDVQTLFPTAPSNYWVDTHPMSPHQWLKAANTAFSNPDELLVYVKDVVDDPGKPASCGGLNYANGPDQGRMIILEGGATAAPYLFAHELGHYFGLVHSFGWATTTDPQTNQPFTLVDNWDLVYKPGDSSSNPHVFFSSRAAAAQYAPSQLALIQQAFDNPSLPDFCPITQSGSDDLVTCTLVGTSPWYTEVYSTGAPQLRGLSFPAATRKAVNIMSYWAQWGSNGGGALSDSQIERIRKYIRWDVPLTTSFQNEVKAGAQHSGRRPQLGSWNTRDSTRLLDFDGDGKHDIGWWIPPQAAGTPGTVKVLLSTRGYSSASGQHINVSFGWLGDSPVPQRIDGDALTDIVFYQPGGGLNRNDPAHLQGWWRRCITATNPVNTNCSSPPGPVQWGERGDVPLPGLDFDGNASTAEVATYRPGTAQFFWNYAGGGWSNSRTLGAAGAVPLPGSYDGDIKTDLATYSPYTATFHLRRSQETWNTVHSRFTHNKFIPQYSASSSSARSGAVVLDGFDTRFTFNSSRRAFALWYPDDGTWNVMWSPLTSSAYTTCHWGIGGRDVPITGIDRDGDHRSDMAVMRLDGVSTTTKVHFRTTTSTGCPTDQHTATTTLAGRARLRAFAVADMTGDGKREIIITDTDSGQIFWLKSEQDYATTHFLAGMASQRAVLF